MEVDLKMPVLFQGKPVSGRVRVDEDFAQQLAKDGLIDDFVEMVRDDLVADLRKNPVVAKADSVDVDVDVGLSPDGDEVEMSVDVKLGDDQEPQASAKPASKRTRASSQ